MYVYNIVVRWTNGDLEGFGASGLTKDVAYQRAVSKAESKAAGMKIPGFDVLTEAEYRALSIDEQDAIQADWDSEDL